MATLEGLEDLVMEIILSKLGPGSVAVLACVSTRLRAATADEALWRAFCSRDLDLAVPQDPDGNSSPSFKVAYQTWRESFAMYPWQLVMRAKNCWSDKKSWMAVNFPEAAETLKKGASEAEIKEVEKKLRVKLPLPTRVLYRFCNGQDTTNNVHHFFLGLIGGYCFYDHLVNVHLLPLSGIVDKTREYRNHSRLSTRSKYIVLAICYFVEKIFLLNCADGQLYVGTKNLSTDGEMLPCVPRALISSMQCSGSGMVQDAMLLWLEEHTRSLQSGLFRLGEFYKKKMISLFPETPPSCTVAVTNGVKVRASAVFVPELCDLNGGEHKHSFAYSIRMSLSPEGCILDGVHYDSCQLYSRHWIIRSNNEVVSDVRGEAVIGKFPLLLPDMVEEFVYESCTSFPESPGSMEGSFTFIPGRLTDPKGREFEVAVAPFPLEAPEYVY